MSISWTTATNLINIGSSPNKGDGDSLRVAFTKINDNFVLLFNQASTTTVSISTATTSTAGVVKIGSGLSITTDGTLSANVQNNSTSTVRIVDSNGAATIDIQAQSGEFVLPTDTTSSVLLFSFNSTEYRSALIDIVADNTDTNAYEYANGYFVTWNSSTVAITGNSPVSMLPNGELSTAPWELRSPTIAGSDININLYNVQGTNTTTNYSWKSKVTLFRV